MVKEILDQRERIANPVVIIDSIQKSSKNMESETNSRTTRAVELQVVSPKCTSLLVPRIISWTETLGMLKSGSLG